MEWEEKETGKCIEKEKITCTFSSSYINAIYRAPLEYMKNQGCISKLPWGLICTNWSLQDV